MRGTDGQIFHASIDIYIYIYIYHVLGFCFCFLSSAIFFVETCIFVENGSLLVYLSMPFNHFYLDVVN